MNKEDGVESKLISVYTFCNFIFDLLRLLAYLLFDIFYFSVNLLYVGSNFHLACDFCCLPFFNPFLSFYPFILIHDPISVIYFLGANLDVLGDNNFSFIFLLVVDDAWYCPLVELWRVPFFYDFLGLGLSFNIFAYFLSYSLDVTIF